MSPLAGTRSTRGGGMSMQGTPIAQLPSMITRIAVDPAGRSIACATAAGTVHLFDTTSLTEVWSARHGGRWRGVPLHSISISGRGDMVCTGGEDGTAVLWSVPDGRRAARLTYEHRVPVLSSSISRDGRQLALGYRTGVIVLRDMVAAISRAKDELTARRGGCTTTSGRTRSSTTPQAPGSPRPATTRRSASGTSAITPRRGAYRLLASRAR